MKLKLFLSTLLLIGISASAWAAPYGIGKYGICEYGGSCAISISTSGTVNLSVNSAAGAKYTIDKDQVSVTTENPNGYSLTVSSTSATDNDLVSGLNTLNSTSASSASPTTLPLNKWGYRVDGVLGFGAGPSSVVTDASSSSLTFAGMPLSGSPQLIKSTATPASGDVTEFWYGAHADITQTAGVYTTTVIYTATAL